MFQKPAAISAAIKKNTKSVFSNDNTTCSNNNKHFFVFFGEVGTFTRVQSGSAAINAAIVKISEKFLLWATNFIFITFLLNELVFLYRPIS